MKKILLSVLALLALAGTGTAQTLPSYVPANGLVGWWPFNGNANDESGNNNNGTVNGATPTTDRFGNAGKAFSFDGVDDIVNTNYSGVNGRKSRTVSFWYNPASLQTDNSKTMVGYGESSSGDQCGKRFDCTLFQNASPSIDLASSYVTYNYSNSVGNWHHYLVTYDSTFGTSPTNIKMYIDGIIQTNILSSTLTCEINTGDIVPVSFGGPYLVTTGHNFHGSLDDIAIYNRALSQQEITALYQSANTTANCPTFPASLTQGLVGYWPFCGNALDESGNNNHGTVNGATLTTDRFGNQGSAYGFDGVSNFIELPDSVLPSVNKSYSISCWALLNADTNRVESYSIFDDRNQTSVNSKGRFVVLGSNPNSYWYQMGDNTPCTSNQLQISSWTHITCIYDNEANSLHVYKNGILDCSTPCNDAEFHVGARKLLIGKGQAPGLQSVEEWRGNIDDIAIYNRVLTQQEITQLYNQGICQTSITVTDTLLIHTGLTSYNPVAYGNTLKVWPNPGNTAITLDAGNLSSMQGWKYKVANTLGQTVVNETAINQQQTNISLSTWGGNGIYYLHLINPQGHAIEIKKIVLAP